MTNKLKTSYLSMEYISKTVWAVFSVIFISIFLDVIIIDKNHEYSRLKPIYISNFIILLSVICIFFLISKFVYKKKESIKIFSDNNFIFCLIIASLILLVIQLVIIYETYFYTDWDVKIIVSTASQIAHGQTYDEYICNYYSMYSNNIMLTGLFALIIKVVNFFGYDNGYLTLLIIGAFIVNFSGFIMAFVAKRITGKSYLGIGAWILFAVWVGLSPWINVPYSDTYAIIFPVSVLYLYTTKPKGWKLFLKWFGIGLLTFFGYYIKPTVIIVLIAILIIEFFKFLNKKTKKIFLSLICLLFIITSYFAVSLIPITLKNSCFTNIDDTKKFTFAHFIMMGLNNQTDGCYYDEDVKFSSSYKTVDERNSQNFDKSIQRIKDYNVWGLSKHLAKKALVNFNDGSFCWEGEGSFYDTIIKRDNKLSTILRSFYYRNAENKNIFMLFEQTIWIFILFLIVCNIFKHKKINNIQNVVLLSVIGVTVFLMIFECRARYLYCYSPILIICAMLGFLKIKDFIVKLVNYKKCKNPQKTIFY